MSYINEYRFINNQQNQSQNNYIRNKSSERIIKRTSFINYDKIYNQFLTTPYPPMYYQRFNKNNENKYNNKINKEISKQNIYDENYNQFIPPQNYNNFDKLNQNKINSFNERYIKRNNYLNNNQALEEELRREERRTPRNKNLNPSLISSNLNYHYNNNIMTENGDDNNKRYKLENNSFNRHTNKIKNIESNEDELIINRKNNNNFNEINNDYNNKLGFSYDNVKEIQRNEGYVSPIIAQIAKKNYLVDNPYTEKDQNLGHSMLKSNPILYPIDTYKFDFNRYI